MTFVNQLEPDALVGQFVRHPPQGFSAARAPDGTPYFVTRFDLLTTADDALLRRVARLPLQAPLRRALAVRTCFVGTTVSEYALFNRDTDPATAAADWAARFGREHPLLIVKDLAIDSPLTSGADREWNRRFVDAARDCGYLIVEGQALAYVPIDFGSVDEYLARLSSSRRSNFKRKLRARDKLDIAVVPTGEAFADDAVVDAHYALYENVYAQSDVHFDKLTRDFFAATFRDPGGTVFAYRRDGLLIGWNLCYEYDGKLIWKYVGYLYPNSREVNLYFVGWFAHLEYALSRGLTHYVAGWTDPLVKKGLGATFHLTHHAVYVRNPALRAVLRRFAHHFESDSKRITARKSPGWSSRTRRS